jgi:isopenicillin N synthase-like dioxygenase
LIFLFVTNGDAIAKQTVVEQIYQACHEIGFMYLQNHGMSQNLIEQVFTQSKNFFNLPLEVKQQFAWSDEYSNQGYVGIERERLNPNKPGDLKEAFNVSKQDTKTFSASPRLPVTASFPPSPLDAWICDAWIDEARVALIASPHRVPSHD